MHKIIVCVISTLLLSACADIPDLESSDVASMARDSELCRSAVSEQLSEELASITMSSDAKKVAYEQRYRFCMTEKGHSVPAAVTL